MTNPDPSPVLDLIEAFRRSKTMFAAVALGVFDRLERGPTDAATLADGIHVQTEPLERLLDGCVGLGLLKNDEGRYTNAPVAATFLCDSSSSSLTGYIRYSNDVLFPLWTRLEDAVRHGSHRWNQVFGVEGGIFDGFFRTDQDMRLFLQAMHGVGLLSSPAIVTAFDLTPFRRLVDLGGATGHLAMIACERYAGLDGVVFDLPAVIAFAREYVSQSRAANRITLVAGDLFESEWPDADVFALGRVLHDWSDEKIETLLRKAFDRLPPGGAVLIAEKLLAEDGTMSIPALMQSLNMLVATEGRERTLSEYRKLLEFAGFRSVQGQVTASPLDAIFGLKPHQSS
jgi:acetylserotonin N-methyltransferase